MFVLQDLRHDGFFFSSRRLHTTSDRDCSSDVCSSDLGTSASLRSRRRIGTMAPIVNAETPANAEIPAKLAAFAAALTMNGMLAAGMAYLFNAPLEQHA